MVEELKRKIYDGLFDLSNETDKCYEIYDNVCEIETIMINEHKEITKKYLDNIRKLESNTDEMYKKLKSDMKILIDQQEKDSENLKQKDDQIKIDNQMLKLTSIFRIGLNVLFNVLASQNITKIKVLNIDWKDLAQKTTFLTRSHRIDDIGTQYALARLHDLIDGLPKNLCSLYIKLNDVYHPSISPIKKLNDCTEELKKIIRTNHLPKIYSDLGLDLQTLNDFEREINSRKQIFN